MRTHVVSLRLSDDEMSALRSFPGARDADRLRAAIQSQAIGQAISAPIVRELSTVREDMEALREKVEHQRDELRALRNRMDHEPVVLPASIEPTLGNISKAVPAIIDALKEVRDYVRSQAK